MSNPPTLNRTTLDCSALSTREINQQIKALAAEGIEEILLLNPAGRHNLAVGLIGAIRLVFQGSVGYYCGGLGEGMRIEVEGSCGWSVGENLMAGEILIRGNASANAAASAHGGRVCILGDAGPRAGISLKGGTLVVGGNVGHSSGFMMQQGCLIITGNAGQNLGDSIYDGEIFVGGEVGSLGADARYESMTAADWQKITAELAPLGITAQQREFKKIVCAKQLYHFQARDFAKWKDAY